MLTTSPSNKATMSITSERYASVIKNVGIFRQLIQSELLSRQELEQILIARKKRIHALILEHCECDESASISREEWQDFCFQQIFQRTCHTNIPFSTYLNRLMPELGFPLGYAHKKLSVYRGLKWK